MHSDSYGKSGVASSACSSVSSYLLLETNIIAKLRFQSFI